MRANRLLAVATLILGIAAKLEAMPLQFFGQDKIPLNAFGLPIGDFSQATYPNAANAEVAFLAHLVGVGTEDFEGFNCDIEGCFAQNLGLTFPGVGTVTFSAGSITHELELDGVHPVSGKQWAGTFAGAGSPVGRSDVTINFDQPVAALGFYGIDVVDGLSSSRMTLTLVGDSTVTIDIPHATPRIPTLEEFRLGIEDRSLNGNVFFFGYIDVEHPWTQAMINVRGVNDVYGLDDLTVGSIQQVLPTPVPEPATLSLLGIGVLGLIATMRRGRTLLLAGERTIQVTYAKTSSVV